MNKDMQKIHYIINNINNNSKDIGINFFLKGLKSIRDNIYYEFRFRLFTRKIIRII